MKVKKEKSGLHIENAAAPWKHMRGLKPLLERAAVATLKSLPVSMQPAARRAEFTLLLTADATVRRLNHDFRGRNKPTNVLSFPHFTKAQLKKRDKKTNALPFYAGDIAVAYKYTVDEARQEGKNPAYHVTHLLIHGLLHLFGYDHLSDGAAARMERLERKLMVELGLPDPYASAGARRRKRKPA